MVNVKNNYQENYLEGKILINENMKIDPNKADINTLQKITGVGPILAERIIAARPFEDLDGLRKVQGISDNVLARLAPHLSLSSDLAANLENEVISVEAENSGNNDKLESLVEEIKAIDAGEELSDTEGINNMVEDTLFDEKGQIEPVAQEESPEVLDEKPIKDQNEKTETKSEPEAKPEPKPRWITMSQALWLAFGSGMVAFVLALVLSLGILAAINGGRLIFASPSQISDLNRQVGAQETTLTTLEEDLAGIRERVDNLETVSGRVTSLEKSVGALDSDLNEAETRIAGVETQIEEASAQILSLEEQNGRFENFFNGLSLLLSDLFSLEDEK
jgi:DNA uptake protein ComE-like DNA-binding protein